MRSRARDSIPSVLSGRAALPGANPVQPPGPGALSPTHLIGLRQGVLAGDIHPPEVFCSSRASWVLCQHWQAPTSSTPASLGPLLRRSTLQPLSHSESSPAVLRRLPRWNVSSGGQGALFGFPGLCHQDLERCLAQDRRWEGLRAGCSPGRVLMWWGEGWPARGHLPVRPVRDGIFP